MRRRYVRYLPYPCLDRWRKWTDPDCADLVLSLAPDGDLRERVKKYGSLSLSCARYYVAQVVDTVQWIHSKGILHRDMKPENILLDSDMSIELMDFGCAYVSETFDLCEWKVRIRYGRVKIELCWAAPRTSTFLLWELRHTSLWSCFRVPRQKLQVNGWLIGIPLYPFPNCG